MTGEVTLPEASPCLACGMIQERRKKEGTTKYILLLNALCSNRCQYFAELSLTALISTPRTCFLYRSPSDRCCKFR
jgi:hypothetical protein